MTRSFPLPAADARLIDEAAERSGLSRSERIRGVAASTGGALGGTGTSPGELTRQSGVRPGRNGAWMSWPAG
ncbi:ribbon-helix-helix protein, CopG family [Saccharopolyspora hirsuta]|uniref:ribbon-helix-helix protein, CopG family n=1 Tax=Saccharopolyspora hirsuta TaxID=1837 RepID=UPI0033303D6C